MQCGNIASRTNGTGCIYTVYTVEDLEALLQEEHPPLIHWMADLRRENKRRQESVEL